MTNPREPDTLVLGGGVVGLSLAYGLARAGEKVRVLDGADTDFRAARGNFGLVWVQGKGLGAPPYAHWTMAAAKHWPALARELAELTGTDVELSQIGGLTMCLDDSELAERAAALASVRESLDVAYPYDVLDRQALRALVPHLGPQVVGAVYSPLDGHVSPLRLLRALAQAVVAQGGELVTGVRAERVERRAGAFHAWAGGKEHVAGKLVLAAGLGNADLAPQVGLKAPVVPVRGQILVTERVQHFLDHPTLHVRQTAEGVVQIGDSKEDVGYDDGTTLEQLARIARRATRCFPLLGGINVVRSWGALRVMSPDGLPIYQASDACPGAFIVSCHSGITLAPQHAGALADWLRGGAQPPETRGFGAERFDV